MHERVGADADMCADDLLYLEPRSVSVQPLNILDGILVRKFDKFDFS